MDAFRLRDTLIEEYSKYVRSFLHIRDERIRGEVDRQFAEGLLWPEPLLHLNPSFEPGEWIEELADEGVLHDECRRIFRIKKPDEVDRPLRLHKHQAEAVKIAHGGHDYVLTTGTGSGKSLAYIIPIVDHVLRRGSGKGIQAVIVYPMNALANSQVGELQKFLCQGYPEGKPPVTFARYTGQEGRERRQEIRAHPPDILLTNYVMLELLLTRPEEKALVNAARGLRFLVLDELHTYRGRQGADVAMLARRAREAFQAGDLQCVGTSATLAGSGSLEEQRAEVSHVASLLFGAEVRPEHVIGETLRRATPHREPGDAEFLENLRARLEDETREAPSDYEAFIEDPLSAWIESTFGLAEEPETGRLIRTTPRSITGERGAAGDLSRLTGLPGQRCVKAIREHLLARYQCVPRPGRESPAFAFRLHQFISRGDKVYATIEPEGDRHVTLKGQQFVPGERGRLLLPLVFCRECGQEYYCVRHGKDPESGDRVFGPRDLSDQQPDEEEGEPGFLYVSTEDPWPEDPAELIRRLPDEWLEEHRGVLRVRRDRRPELPGAVRVGPDGRESDQGTGCHLIGAPFRFCLRCGVSYAFRQRTDFTKLGSLATEGRSTATTVLALTAIRYLRADPTLEETARKLLSFTDNRQDASLQAGHFNDFVEVGLLRSALYRAAREAEPEGLRQDILVQKVFDALALPREQYASDPDVRFQAEEETHRALRSVLAYRLYRDLKRGWRITLPNLEQCGLLEIRYLSLDDLCAAEDVWEGLHPSLAGAAPETRVAVATTLLDLMRRDLAIKVECLQAEAQERTQQQSSQRLRQPWALDESEKMERAAILFPRPVRAGQDYGGNIFLSPRGGFGQYLRRPATFPDNTSRLNLEETGKVIRDLLEALRIAGLVEIVQQPRRGDDEVPGYQLQAAAMVWRAGDGTRPSHDPIRVPRASAEGGRPNPYFLDFYREVAAGAVGIEAREHTAQVRYEERLDREERFREGRLPILFCSPTMELGVDIADLNAVNMRNIPPTPANYAQRSGRAGRQGQPAVVISYCSTFSSHDQHFFKRPELMVAGAVTPPRLDLANEDLVRAHVHAVWLAETGLPLESSLKDVLDLSGEEPSLEFLPSVRAALDDLGARARARERARRILETIREDLERSDWYGEGWLDEAMARIPLEFDRACERWRGLYRAAARQRALQHRIISDASRSAQDKKRARRLRAEAEAQIELLTETRNVVEADFYSYRYFASEGFLPGYSFPRLPLSAYIPGRRTRSGRDEFLQRPRFLAIREFGPRAIIYHEGSRYRINRAILPVTEDDTGEGMPTASAKQCEACGYLHPITQGDGPDLCERCDQALGQPLRQLFRLQNVSTQRADRITSDEEERLRIGYELRTAIRFPERGGRPSFLTARAVGGNGVLATLSYGHAATLWRINLGWARRANRQQYGFVLDTERGYWARNQADVEDEAEDPTAPRTQRVIPYVEDRRNSLLLEPAEGIGETAMASLQAALKSAIQVEYELEDSELASEALPSRHDRRLVLLYEAAEGGAGVLRHLVGDSGALGRVARSALEVCHFDPASGRDLRRARRAREDCEAACYDCLMSYSNQMDHRLLDRQAIRDILMALAAARVETSPGPLPRAEHLAALLRQCESGLEEDWLRFLEKRDLRLPSRAQVFVEECRTRPDFLYDSHQAAIYVDGPHHRFPERQQRDQDQTDAMEDLGYTVVRFSTEEDWESIVSRHPGIFGGRE